jgi:leucyl-tRNA synthetase
LHQTIAKITADFDGRWHFNTSIAQLMIFVNLLRFIELPIENGFAGLRGQTGWVPPQVTKEVFRTLVKLLAPFAPFLASELWEELGEEGAVLCAPWPVSDPELAREDELEIPVQINGKLVTVVRVAADAGSKAIEAAALADGKVQSRAKGKTVAKVIVIPGKLVNLVVK